VFHPALQFEPLPLVLKFMLLEPRFVLPLLPSLCPLACGPSLPIVRSAWPVIRCMP
jgi:hypothetical protein